MFFVSTTASEVFSRLCQIEDAAHKYHETTKLHPCHSWPSLKLELSMLRPMAEKYKEFRDFLAEQRKNNDIAERFNVGKDAASLFVYRLANIGVVSKNRKLG